MVMAIVLVLAGISLAALGKVREAQEATVCASNLRQLGMMIRLYMADNANRFPKGPDNSYVKWVQTLKNHAGISDAQDKLFRCPADTVLRAVPGSLRSYAVNAYLAPFTPTPSRGVPGRNLVVNPPEPSNMMMLSERARPYSIVGRDESNEFWNAADLTPLHRGNTHAGTLFLDGHVALLPVRPIEAGFQQKYINPLGL